MQGHDIIVIGGSAGAIPVLSQLISNLPNKLEASIFVVIHISGAPSLLPEILGKRTMLSVVRAKDGEEFQRGYVYVAQPNQHLLIKKGYIELTGGPKVNWSRPAIDPLFCSAATHYGPRVVGILLTGLLDDGTAGLMAIKNHGGIVIVQDPQEAEYKDMPQNALENVAADHCVPIDQIAPILLKMTAEPVTTGKFHPSKFALDLEERGHEAVIVSAEELDHIGARSDFGCPECHGVLWEIKDNLSSNARYRCRVGHEYGIKSLLAVHSSALEGALWAAVRALEENSAICYRIATRASKNLRSRQGNIYFEKGKVLEENATNLRKIILKYEEITRQEHLQKNGQ